jgi:hypothetical protein
MSQKSIEKRIHKNHLAKLISRNESGKAITNFSLAGLEFAISQYRLFLHPIR